MTKFKFCLILTFFILTNSFANYIPEIKVKNDSDLAFKQLRFANEEWNKNQNSEEHILFFKYTTGKNEDVFSIAASFNLNYDTIASLNNIVKAKDLAQDTVLYIPSAQGIYLREKTTILTRILNSSYNNDDAARLSLPNGETIYFFSDKKFNTDARSFFLNYFFISPIPKTTITSPFGNRKNPFTGAPSYHFGIDLSAKPNTQIRAPKEGIVEKKGYNNVFGNYLLIKHEHGYKTFYGHLNEILVQYNMTVKAGETIALSGDTGITTGPHLHFEIRLDNNPVDPQEYIKF